MFLKKTDYIKGCEGTYECLIVKDVEERSCGIFYYTIPAYVVGTEENKEKFSYGRHRNRESNS
jgi:hypothetical protein